MQTTADQRCTDRSTTLKQARLDGATRIMLTLFPAPAARRLLWLMALLQLASCTILGSPENPLHSTDFTRYIDQPLSADAASYLRAGPQSQPGPLISKAARRLDGRNRRQRLYQAIDYIWSRFRYERSMNSAMLSRTAEQLFEQGALGGCADYALAETALLRASGVPARLVLTANVAWMKRYKVNALAMTTGHVFIEVFLEDRWYLVDPTYRFLYPSYTPTSKSYPRGEYFVMRGLDFWELGLIDVPTLVDLFREQALAFQRDQYDEPAYAIDGVLPI